MQAIVNNFPISEREYDELERKFGKLCHKAAWILKQKNYNNNVTDEQTDIVQNLRISMIKAGSYYKRQEYIESCLSALNSNVKDKFIKKLLKELENLWENRRRHGANRQKFGPFQEAILDQLVKKHVPQDQRPNRERPLEIDPKFTTYCKQIIWNCQKSMGKKITREKSWRTGLVSLSEYDYLGSQTETAVA